MSPGIARPGKAKKEITQTSNIMFVADTLYKSTFPSKLYGNFVNVKMGMVVVGVLRFFYRASYWGKGA